MVALYRLYRLRPLSSSWVGLSHTIWIESRIDSARTFLIARLSRIRPPCSCVISRLARVPKSLIDSSNFNVTRMNRVRNEVERQLAAVLFGNEVSATKVICPFRQPNRMSPNVKSTPVAPIKGVVEGQPHPRTVTDNNRLDHEGKSYTP